MYKLIKINAALQSGDDWPQTRLITHVSGQVVEEWYECRREIWVGGGFEAVVYLEEGFLKSINIKTT